ncbi:MAG: phosphoadenylyl-sulfate reductase [Actinobacteria bacterium]|nr:phosphoadenylyl-sulfate reductase [Actinomycetota bacterium]
MSRSLAIDEYDAGELAVRFEAEPPEELLAWALDRFHPRLAIAEGGGAEGMVILDMAVRIEPEVRVFTLDTGRLPEESYDLVERVRARYGVRMEMVFPEAEQVEALTGRHGPNLMRQSVDLRLLCCQVRKVLPLQRHLRSLDAWVTGLRREQWASRAEVRKLELDHDHGGIVKLNPLADWTKGEVWDYIRANDVPYHALYDQGYTSIGCAPCTRAIQPGEPDRAGRWWWETDGPKECGIHCAIYTGGFEHELEAILGRTGSDGAGHDRAGPPGEQERER